MTVYLSGLELEWECVLSNVLNQISQIEKLYYLVRILVLFVNVSANRKQVE